MKKTIIVLLCFLLYDKVSFAQISWQYPVGMPPCCIDPIFFGGVANCNTNPYKLVFQDEFNGELLDNQKWYTYNPRWPQLDDQAAECRDRGPLEDQIYKDENVIPNNGSVILRAKNELSTWYGNTRGHSSGTINSKPGFKYGKFEIRCKLPSQSGFWPAFWLWGHDEIDVLEYCTHDITKHRMSVHMKDCNNDGVDETSSNKHIGIDASNGFYTFTVEWDYMYLRWYCDGVLLKSMYRFANGINGQPIMCGDNVGYGTYLFNNFIPDDTWFMVIKANLAVNSSVPPIPNVQPGNFCYENHANVPGPTTNFPVDMEIDYIRAWQRTPQAGLVDLCALRNFVGPSTICSTQVKTFMVEGGHGDLQWSVSNNLEITETGGNYIKVKVKSGITGGYGTVNLVETNSPCSSNYNLTHHVGINGPGIISVTSDPGGCGDPIIVKIDMIDVPAGSSNQPVLSCSVNGTPCMLMAYGSSTHIQGYYASYLPPDNDYCYPIEITATNSCGTSTHAGIVGDYCNLNTTCSGDVTQDFRLLNSVSLWPNPANSNINISFVDDAQVFVLEINIIQATTSNIIHTIDHVSMSEVTHLDCSNWPPGIYLAQFVLEEHPPFYKNIVKTN